MSHDLTWWPVLSDPYKVKLINEKLYQILFCCFSLFSSFWQKTTGRGSKWPPPGRRLSVCSSWAACGICLVSHQCELWWKAWKLCEPRPQWASSWFLTDWVCLWWQQLLVDCSNCWWLKVMAFCRICEVARGVISLHATGDICCPGRVLVEELLLSRSSPPWKSWKTAICHCGGIGSRAIWHLERMELLQIGQVT